MEKTTDKQPDQESKIKHDIFEDPAIARSLKEDPVARFLAKYWNQLLMVVLAFLAVYYIKNRIQETYANNLGEAADLYMRTQLDLNQYEAASEEKKEAAEKAAQAGDQDENAKKALSDAQDKEKEARGRLTEAVTALGDAKEPYSVIAAIYKDLEAVRSGDAGEAQAKAGQLPKLESVPLKNHSERFFLELKQFALSKALLNEQKTTDEGRKLLIDLAKKGAYADVPAAVTLAKIALSPEQREEARSLLESIVNAKPDQAQVVEEELNRLKQ